MPHPEQQQQKLVADGSSWEGGRTKELTLELSQIRKQLVRLSLGQEQLSSEVHSILESVGVQISTKNSFTAAASQASENPIDGQSFVSRTTSKNTTRNLPSIIATTNFSHEKKKRELGHAFAVAAEFEAAEQKQRESMQSRGFLLTWWQKDPDLVVDMAASFLIGVNALMIGLSMDLQEENSWWTAINIFFPLAFIAEVCIKVHLHGLQGHFCGSHAFAHCFEAVLIVADIAQLALELAFPILLEGGAGVPPATLFRILRLFRLARILKMLKAAVFKDLLKMIHGIMGGMTTLIWSMVLYSIVVYVISLVFREFLGNGQNEHIQAYFNGVPRAMFTTFRCSFGDCSSAAGVPIFEHVALEYGITLSLFYCIFTFVITIGLFNVISAVFVESTLTAAQALDNKKKNQRLADETRLFSNVAILLRRILHITEYEIQDEMQELDALVEMEFPTGVIDELIQDSEAVSALEALDINPLDYKRLSDIFDPDNGGTVTLGDIGEGIRRLRGDPRRSDVICLDLMMRSIQRDIKVVHSQMASSTSPTSQL